MSGRVGILFAFAVLAGAAFFGLRALQRDGAEELTLEERYRQDPRLVPLVDDCPFGKAFDQDTTDIAWILAKKLDAGAQLEPLRRAKQDLADMGEEARAALRRVYDDAVRAQWRVAVVRNVLDVLAISDDPFGLAIAREAITSPREDVRVSAALVLKKHGTEEDYDTLAQVLDLTLSPENRQRIANAMQACDGDRFARDVARWLDEARAAAGDDQLVTPFLDGVVSSVAEQDDPELAALLRETADGLPPRFRAYLLAPSAALGDEDALVEMRDMLAHSNALVQQHAVLALGAAGLGREAYVLFATSSKPRLRQLAAEVLARVEGDPEVDGWLREGLTDASANVRNHCLAALLERGDETGVAHALLMLRSGVQERGMAIQAMRGAWDAEPGLADRARAILVREWERIRGSGTLGSQGISVLSTIALVPGRESGELLLDVGRELAGTAVKGIDGHRWAAGQCYNAGPEARDLLRERLAVEGDPFRRLDLIAYAWQDRSEDALEQYLALVQDETKSPYERLYVADCLVQIGAPARVAPVLKGVYWQSTDPVLRPGLQCLLWIWYGVDP